MRAFRFIPETKMPELNGKPYPMLGTNICFFRFVEDPKRGATPWDEEWVRALYRQFKHMHWNSVRHCIGFPPELWYRIADEEGILVQDEFPIWSLTNELPLTVDQLAGEYAEWMQEHLNYPSVVIWDAQNESAQTTAYQTGEALARVRELDRSNRPWDNGWGDPQAPGDSAEVHSYPMMGFMRNGKGDYAKIIERFGEGRHSKNKALTENPNAVILNEYAWLWLDRDGLGTALTEAGYKTMLPGASVDERRVYYAKTLAAMTERYRSLGTVAAVLHFCGLAHSVPDCYTSDNFIDMGKLEYEHYFETYVRDAFSPMGVMIDLWSPTLPRGKKSKIDVVLINDTAEDWKGDLALRLKSGDSVVWEDTKTGAAESGDRVPVTFKVPVAKNVGDYRLEAELVTADGDTVTSIRDFSVVSSK
jgi:hypothetical protein